MTEDMQKETQPISYIHIDEFLMSNPDIRPEVKAGFRVFMKGRTYQTSYEAFQEELQKYLTRKI